MKKNRISRILCAAAVLVWLCGFFCTANAEKTDGGRLLTRVTFNSAGNVKQVTELKYDDRGNLIAASSTFGKDYRYVYDSEDRLIEVYHPLFGDEQPQYRYTYDENGYLVQISGFGEGGGVNVTLENDELGRVIRETSSNFTTGTTVREYSYNDDGTRVEITETSTHPVGIQYADKEPEMETEVSYLYCTYTFDEQGRILTEEMSNRRYPVRYNYSFLPFVAYEDGKELEGDTHFQITDAVGRRVWKLPNSEVYAIIQDAELYVETISCKDGTFWFHYE